MLSTLVESANGNGPGASTSTAECDPSLHPVTIIEANSVDASPSCLSLAATIGLESTNMSLPGQFLLHGRLINTKSGAIVASNPVASNVNRQEGSAPAAKKPR